jgi:DNA-binding PadR family transcriptional regulator
MNDLEDAGLIEALRQISRARGNRQGWAPRPKSVMLGTVSQLARDGYVDTLGDLKGEVLVKVTPAGLRALAASPGRAA